METVLITAIGSFSADIVIKKCRENGIRVIGCDIYPGEWIADAGSVDAFYQVPYATDTERYMESLLQICCEEGVEAVLPLTDAEVDVLNLRRREFADRGITLCMSGEDCIGLCRDKMELFRYLEERRPGTAIPTRRLREVKPDSLAYPVVCKPYNGRSSQGLRFIRSRREMEVFMEEEDPAGYIVQPLVQGNVVTVDVVRDPAGGACAAVCRRELLRTLNGAGTSVLVFRSPRLEETCREIAGWLGVKGCVNIEFMEDSQGEYHMLECNPRFSGGVEFSCLAGYDCVTNHLRCFEGKAIEGCDQVTGMYIARKYEEYITKTDDGRTDGGKPESSRTEEREKESHEKYF